MLKNKKKKSAPPSLAQSTIEVKKPDMAHIAEMSEDDSDDEKDGLKGLPKEDLPPIGQPK
jgi:hypothetical protein